MADGSLKFDTKLDSSGVKKGLDGIKNTTKNAFGVAEKSVKAVTAATGAMAAGLAGLTAASVKAYAEYEQLVGGVETLFGDSSGAVLEYANNAYKTAGLSANAYMETVTGFSASLLQNLDGDTAAAAEKADRAVTDMADNANKMGTSMESIQNAYQGFAKQNYTMLDNLKLGYGGTKEEMERLLEDATAISGVEYDLSSYADIMDAIHVVQTEMHISGITAEEAAEAVANGTMTEEEAFEAMGTTAKEASTTIQGSVGMMKSAWENFLTGMADPEQDFDSLLGNLIDSVVTVADNIIPRIEETLPRIVAGISEVVVQLSTYLPGIIESLLPVLLEGSYALIESLMAAFPEFMGIILEFAPQIIDMAVQLLEFFIQGLTDNLPLIMSSGGEILSALVGGVVSLFPALGTLAYDLITNLLTSITENADSVVQSGADTLASFIDGITEKIPDLLMMAVDAIIALAESVTKPDTLVNIINAGIELILSLVTGILNALPQLMDAAPTIIANLVAALIASIPRLLEAAIEIMLELGKFLLQSVPKLIRRIPDIFKKLVDAFKNMDWKAIGSNIIDGIKNGILNTAANLVSSAVEAAKAAVKGVKDFLGIHSPSTLMRDVVGKNMIAGAGEGIEEETPELEKQSSEAMNSALTAMKKQMDKTHTGMIHMNLIGAIDDYGIDRQIEGNIKNSIGNIRTNVKGIGGKMKTDFDYSRMGEEMAYAMERSGFKVEIGKREFGRIVREVIV